MHGHIFSRTDTFDSHNELCLALLLPAFCLYILILLQLIQPALQENVPLKSQFSEQMSEEQMFHHYSEGINSD